MIGITQAQVETKQANLISHQCRGLWKQLRIQPPPLAEVSCVQSFDVEPPAVGCLGSHVKQRRRT